VTDLDQVQRDTAERFSAQFAGPSADSKVGISLNVRAGVVPLNAHRHLPENGASGWYIWAGEVFSEDPDFFMPLHVSHLETWCPEILPYLGLPPGWRVLLAPGYEDVWYDEVLLPG